MFSIYCFAASSCSADAALIEFGKQRLERQAARNDLASERRFAGNSISREWKRVGSDADYVAHTQRALCQTYGRDGNLKKLIYAARRYYVDVELKDDQDIDTIRYYFDRAEMEENPIYLIRAYTMQTSFYRKLNEQLASMKIEGIGPRDTNRALAYIVGIIAHHPQFDDFSFDGICYRGMCVPETELDDYIVGQRMMTKSFHSTSMLNNVAKSFCEGPETGKEIRLLVTYHLRNKRSGLRIEEVSEYSQEKEVLIMPYTAFKIIKVTKDKVDAEIELKECLPW